MRSLLGTFGSSIRFKVAAPLLVLVLATGSTVAFVTFVQSRETVVAVTSDLHEQISSRISHRLWDYLSEPQVVLEGNADALARGWLDPADQDSLSRFFWEQVQRYDSVTSLYFGNTEGGLALGGREGPDGSLYVMTTDNFEAGEFAKYRTDAQGNPTEQLLSIPDFDARSRPWYEAAIAADGAAWSDVYILFTETGMAIAPSRVVRDRDGNLLGVVASDLFLSHIDEALREIQAGHAGHSFVMEPSGLIVASSTRVPTFVKGEAGKPPRRIMAEDFGVPAIAKSAAVVRSSLGGLSEPEAARHFPVDLEGERHWLTVASLDAGNGLHWLVGVVAPESAYLGEVLEANRKSAILVVGALVLATLLGLWLAYSITNPIASIRRAAEGIAGGDHFRRIDADRSDELGALAKSFNRMAEELEGRIEAQNRKIVSTREAEELLRQLTENLRDVLWMSDVDKERMFYVSPSYEKVWDRTLESHYSNPMSFLDAVHPEDRTRVIAELPKQIRGEYDVEFRILRQDGSIHWIRDRAFPIFDGDGEPYRIVGICEDITERKSVASDIEESERRMATMLDNLPGAAYRARNDENWTIEYISAGYHMLKGGQRTEASGLVTGEDAPLFEVRPDYETRTRREVESAIAEGRPYEHVFPVTIDGGEERWLWERGRCVSQPGVEPEILEGIIIDVTEQHHLEERLHGAEKMQALGQLTGGVAHDFNNLLAVVLGHLELARDEAFDSEQRGHIDSAMRAADRGAALTGQLLAFGRRQALRPVATDLNALVSNMQSLLQRTLGETIVIETRLADDPGPTMVDRGQLENAILNLAINARDAMPRGGKLTIETGAADLAAGDFADDVEEFSPGRYLMIAIGDDGAGMMPEVAARAFEPFFTTKPLGQGTGLGLAMVYGFVRQSGGQVKMETEPGRGTRVALYLPEADGPVETVGSDAAAPGTAGPKAQGERVLVVEDDAEVRALVSGVLEKLGYVVRTASDGAEALAVLDANGDIDVLLTDVVLPGGLRGPDLIRQALALRPYLAVAYMSGYPEGELSRGHGLPDGVEILTKPFRIEDLNRHLRQVIEDAARRGHDADSEKGTGTAA